MGDSFLRNTLFFIGLFLCLITSQAFGQCSGEPIQGFKVTQVSPTTDNTANGTIAVAVAGGEAPFVYTLTADYGGKGKQVVSTSAPTAQRTHTFRQVASNVSLQAVEYMVEVQSSNSSQAQYPAVLCQRRTISNIEVK